MFDFSCFSVTFVLMLQSFNVLTWKNLKHIMKTNGRVWFEYNEYKLF